VFCADSRISGGKIAAIVVVTVVTIILVVLGFVISNRRKQKQEMDLPSEFSLFVC